MTAYRVTDLGTNLFYADGNNLNNRGEVVVGGLIYSNGAFSSLPSFGGSSTSAAAVNGLGRVVGASVTAGGQSHGFFYDPATGRPPAPPVRSTMPDR